MKKAALILTLLLTVSGIPANAADKNAETATYINDKGDKYISITRNEKWQTDEITSFIVADV